MDEGVWMFKQSANPHSYCCTTSEMMSREMVTADRARCDMHKKTKLCPSLWLLSQLQKLEEGRIVKQVFVQHSNQLKLQQKVEF